MINAITHRPVKPGERTDHATLSTMELSGPPSVPPFYWCGGEGDEPGDPPAGAFGHDGSRWFVVNDLMEVRAISPTGAPPWLVNGTLDAFTQFMKDFAAEWGRRASLGDVEAAAQVDRLRRRLAQVDPRAALDSSWWSLVLEQLDDELL